METQQGFHRNKVFPPPLKIAPYFSSNCNKRAVYRYLIQPTVRETKTVDATFKTLKITTLLTLLAYCTACTTNSPNSENTTTVYTLGFKPVKACDIEPTKENCKSEWPLGNEHLASNETIIFVD